VYILYIHNTLHYTPINRSQQKKYKRDKGAVGYKRNDEKPVYTDSGWNKWWEVTKRVREQQETE
jgi:hypothetical protein